METREEDAIKIVGRMTEALRESFKNLARESWENVVEEYECTFDLDEDDFVT